MCDTDDTEALLLVRPDAFALESLASEAERSRESRFVETLVRSVDSLRSRLESLESASYRHVRSHTFPKRAGRRRRRSANRPKPNGGKKLVGATFPHLDPYDRRPFSDIDALSDSSAGDSSLDMEPEVDAPFAPQRNVDDAVLREIESFLSGIDRFESEPYSCVETPSFRRPTKLVDEAPPRLGSVVLHRSEPPNDKVVNDLLSKYIYLDKGATSKRGLRHETVSSYENVKNVPQNECTTPTNVSNANTKSAMTCERFEKAQTRTSECDENQTRVPCIPTCSIMKTATSIKQWNDLIGEPYADRTNDREKIEDNEISQSVFDNRYGIIDPNAISNVASRSCNSLSHKQFRTLPTLSQLWSDTPDSKCQALDSLKLEEEKMRRQHCESVIHELQKKHLEHRQKIAVAVEVDSVKEGIISKLKQVCKDLSQRLSYLENDHEKEIRYSNVKLQQSQDIIQKLNEEILKKENEAEFVKTSINKCNEQKELLCAENEKIKTQMTDKVEEMKMLLRDKENHLDELKESSNLIIQLNKQVTENFEVAKNNLTTVENENTKILGQLNELKLSNDALQNEISIIRSENSDLTLKFDEERSLNIHLESQKNKLQKVLDEAYKKIDLLEGEFNNFKGIIQLQKAEMKTYYQKEVESIVKNKVNEFQNDLDAAKVIMANELQNREKEIAFQFAKHLYKVEQHHENEICILEEKHKEQIKLFKIQLNKSNQSVLQLEEKLLFLKSKRGEITKQLHNAMESQWQQALKIVNHTNTPEITNIEENKISQAIAHNRVSPTETDRICNSKNGYKNMTKEIINENIPIDNEQLQHYLKILLPKLPNVFGSHIKELSPPQQKFQESLLKSNSMECNQNPLKEILSFEYPTTDKIVENSDKRNDRNIKIKPPWK